MTGPGARQREDTILQVGNNGVWVDWQRGTRAAVERHVQQNKAGVWRGVDIRDPTVVVVPPTGGDDDRP